MNGVGKKGMSCPAAEKAEIIELVEQSHLAPAHHNFIDGTIAIVPEGQGAG